MNGLPDPTGDQLWDIWWYISDLPTEDLDWLLSKLDGWDATIDFWIRNESSADDLIGTLKLIIEGQKLWRIQCPHWATEFSGSRYTTCTATHSAFH